MPKHARQRQGPKHPHKPSSMRLGPRRLADRRTDSIARAWALLRSDHPLMLHPINWQAIKLERGADGSYTFGAKHNTPDGLRTPWGLPDAIHV